MRRLVAILIGVILSSQAFSDSAEGKSQPPPPVGPFGRPVLPGPHKKGQVHTGSFPLISPGPPILRAPVPLPGPVPGTVLVPGHWQGNRWVPGRLELREKRP